MQKVASQNLLLIHA
jgi:hypothetical protein